MPSPPFLSPLLPGAGRTRPGGDALVQRGQVGLVVSLARATDDEDVCEGVSFARLRDIVRSLPEPSADDEDQAPTTPAPSEPSSAARPIQFGSSALANNDDAAADAAFAAPGQADGVQAAAFASGAGGFSGHGQMSFGTAVEASPAAFAVAPSPAVDEERGVPGLEGEGEALAIDSSFALPSDAPVPTDAAQQQPQDADAVVAALAAPALAEGLAEDAGSAQAGTKRARGPRGPRKGKGPRSAEDGSATPTTEGGALAPPLAKAGADGKRRARSPRPASGNSSSGGANGNGSTNGAGAGSNGERRRAPRPPKKDGPATPRAEGEGGEARGPRKEGGGRGGRGGGAAGGGMGAVGEGGPRRGGGGGGRGAGAGAGRGPKPAAPAPATPAPAAQ